MKVLFVGKSRHRHHGTIAAFLSLGRSRGHLVTLVDKRSFSDIALREFDVVCMKSHHADPHLWQRIHANGIRAVNCWQATQMTEVRSRLEVALRKHGIPIPPAALTNEELQRLQFPVIRKSQNSAEHTLQILSTTVASSDHKCFFYQEMIPAEAVYKVYCVGTRLFSFEVQTIGNGLELSQERRRVESPPRKMVDAIRLVQAATGLEIYNVDFVPFDNNYLVIDVNPFPGFSGIAEAADAWWDYLESLQQPGHDT